MKVELLRFHHGEEDTLGLLFVDGVFFCFTLEDEFRDKKVMGETRIPEGTYALTLRFSPSHSVRYGHDMIYLKDVPGFQGIMFHAGNTQADTAGCLLVGMKVDYNKIGTSMILRSREAYENLYPVLSNGIKSEGAYIEVKRLRLL